MTKLYLIFVSVAILIFLIIGLFKSNNELDKMDNDLSIVTNENTETSKPSHFLVLGSFLDKYNAEGFQETMSDLGYQTKILESDDGYYRIYIFSSIYKDDVYQFKDKYSSEINKMWVYSLD